ncbi:ZN839 protein, partial [Rhabdornis inornatus]|nr:ZN839 protein [Rhabdornis inornatus]
SLAPIQSKTITLSQPVGRNSSIPGLGIINPQIIRIEPVSGTEQQQLFVHSSSESPVQLLMQRPLPSHGSVSVDKIPPSKMVNGQRATCATASASRSPNPTMAAASSANTPCLEKKQKDDKLKKSLKVKTRSGRISRPPKYKAKDYKFIKMEDLADGHQSDSDDYSELSIEDDEEGKVKGKDALFSSSNYNLKPKTFKCQTCEKSYIGKGGLARHYKLNPDHGQLESSPQKIPLNKPNGSIFVEEEIMSPAHLDSTAVTLNHEKTLATKSDESRHLLAEQPNENSSRHQGPVAPKAPGRPRRPKRRGRPRMGGRSRCSGRLSRTGQSPSKSLSSVSAEHNVFRRKARLKELIQQCDNEDLMELALPRLIKLVTVYEFLLMKVEKGHPAKAYFPDVYREFEDLHNMVKKMAYDHLSNSDSVNCQQPVEIKDAKVAESLGITEVLSGEQKLQGADSYSQCIIKMVNEQVPVDILGQKRLAESSGEELLPPAKRTKLEDVTENVSSAYANQDEVKEKSGNLCTLLEKDGNLFRFSSSVLFMEELNKSLFFKLLCFLSYSFISQLASQVLQKQLFNWKSLMRRGKLQMMQTAVAQFWMHDNQLLILLMSIVLSSAVCFLARPSSWPQPATIAELPELCGTWGKGRAGVGCPVSITGIHLVLELHHFAPQSSEEHNSLADSGVRIDGENSGEASLLHTEVVLPVRSSSELEKAFSTNVPINYPHSAQAELHQNAVQGASLSVHGNQENAFKNQSECSCGTEEAQELANTVTVDETVAFEISDESHDFLSQGHEQIFIQTSDGLILSHPDTAVLSQAEGIVIVTDSNGTTMQIRT